MTIIEKIIRSTEIGSEHDSYRRDTLTLTWQDRRQGHGRRQSDGGLAFAISLPNGTVLKGSDCMILDPERTIVKVIEATEPVYILRPKTPPWSFTHWK